MNDTLTAIGALLAGAAGCSGLFLMLWRGVTGARAVNVTAALAGAAKLIVDELQEEVRAAREETRLARRETELLRNEIGELRRITGLEIERLKTENASLLQRLANGRPPANP